MMLLEILIPILLLTMVFGVIWKQERDNARLKRELFEQRAQFELEKTAHEQAVRESKEKSEHAAQADRMLDASKPFDETAARELLAESKK